MPSPNADAVVAGDPPRRPGAANAGGIHSDEASALHAALVRLATADRLVLVLRFYLDLSQEEVAAILGISPSAARVRTRRALARLRPRLVVTEESSR